MEKLSRVKKYEELRKSIETDNHVDKKEEATLHNDDTLKRFDSSVLKKAEIKEDTYQPGREKVIEEVKEETGSQGEEAGFTNEYLDDFIREVRQYNIRKGTRECENTQVDILNQLNAVNRAKRTQYVEKIEDEVKEEPMVSTPVKQILKKEDIALEVQNLLREEDEVEDEEEVKEETPVSAEVNEQAEMDVEQTLLIKDSFSHLDDEIEDTSDESEEEIEEEEEPAPKKRGFFKKKKEETDDEEEENDDIPVSPTIHKKLLEETQQLRVQMDEYEDELPDLSEGVEKTNKLLNFVLCFLILVLLVIIGFIAYSLLKAGGKI